MTFKEEKPLVNMKITLTTCFDIHFSTLNMKVNCIESSINDKIEKLLFTILCMQKWP